MLILPVLVLFMCFSCARLNCSINNPGNQKDESINSGLRKQ